MHTRTSHPRDCVALAPRLRDEDVSEIYAASGIDPLTSLKVGLAQSMPCLTILDDSERVMAMYGVIPWRNDSGGVWLLASTDLMQSPYRFEFARKCREYVNELLKEYELLASYVDERNTTHVRWLKWLGAVFIKRHEKFGFEQRPFLEFVLLRGMNNV